MPNVSPVAVAALLIATAACAQSPSMRPTPAVPPSSAAMAPVNDLPNPYRTVEGWARLPAGRTWGSTSAVAIDRDGSSVWVAERCGTNSCAGSPLAPVLHFDANGTLLHSFGAGMILSPHGIEVDPDGNVWVVDCACTGGRPAAGAAATPPGPAKGHQVFKFSPRGELLMTLGTPGGGRDAAYFWQPNDVLIAPDGSIFVTEGHASQGNPSARVYKFDRAGKLLKTWGTWGKGPDEFDQPHSLAMDSRGRLFVADRGNDRIVIFDQEGRRLDTWYQFGRPSGLAIGPDDTLYSADSESGSVAPPHRAWTRGIRIGSARDGTVRSFIPDPAVNPPSTSSAEGVAVDRRGVVYGAEVGQKALKRYERAR